MFKDFGLNIPDVCPPEILKTSDLTMVVQTICKVTLSTLELEFFGTYKSVYKRVGIKNGPTYSTVTTWLNPKQKKKSSINRYKTHLCYIKYIQSPHHHMSDALTIYFVIFTVNILKYSIYSRYCKESKKIYNYQKCYLLQQYLLKL